MKYPLENKNSFESNLLFWMAKFFGSKLNSLSNRLVDDKDTLASIIYDIKNVTSKEELFILLKKARNIGLGGINTYAKPLQKLYEYLNSIKISTLKDIDEELCIDFLAVHTSKLSTATKKNYRAALIGFFKYIDKQNSDSFSFDIELKNYSGARGNTAKLPSFMSENEIKRFLKAIDEYKFHKDLSDRNRLLIKLILYTGMRVGEAIHITLKDIFLEGDVYIMKLVGKGNKHRTVLIKANHIKEHLDTWLALRTCEKYLFCNKKGNLLTQAYISRMVEKILLSAGIKKEKNGAHMLRHTFATLLYHKRKDLVLVQEALGHASINTSRIYTHFDPDKLRSVASVMDDL